MYKVTDSRTGQTMKVCKTLKGAHRVADRMDAEYGAVRYIVARVPDFA